MDFSTSQLWDLETVVHFRVKITLHTDKMATAQLTKTMQISTLMPDSSSTLAVNEGNYKAYISLLTPSQTASITVNPGLLSGVIMSNTPLPKSTSYCISLFQL